MEDDLLLNFSSSGPKATKSVAVKAKGNWRDKRRSLKQARRHAPGIEKAAHKEPAPLPVAPPPAPAIADIAQKQPRVDTRTWNGKRSENSKTASRGPGSSAGQASMITHRPRNAVDKDTFLSSLFSSNPDVSDRVQATVNLDVTNAPLGESTFPGLDVQPRLCNVLESRMHIECPTEIQRRAIPQILEHANDSFIVAQTGSGKTLAYLLPILCRLMRQPGLSRTSGVFAVILTPTRELATQIFQVAEELVKACHWLVPGIVIGGEKKKSEKGRLRKGVNLLIGTPGRIADHFENTASLDLAQIRWVVLDEGDRLVELGFEETLTQIMDQISAASNLTESKLDMLPTTRTNILCSATMTGSVERLKTLALKTPMWIRASDGNEKELAPGQLLQNIMIVPAKLRLVTLAAELVCLSRKGPGRAIVFFSCSDSIDYHFSAFTGEQESFVDDEEGAVKTALARPATRISQSVTVFKLHGSLSQQDRTKMLSEFAKSDGFAVLLCTDVASRGLDVSVDYVIEYDPPFAVEDHIHRVGRTARAGRNGESLLFLLPGDEEKYAERIEPAHPNGLQHLSYKSVLKSAFGTRWEIEATTWHLNVERWLLQNEEAHQKAKRAFTSHIRAYTTHLSQERAYFNMRNLHLGHLAKSFGLRDKPGEVSGGSALRSKKSTPKKSAHATMLSMAKKHTELGEYNIA